MQTIHQTEMQTAQMHKTKIEMQTAHRTKMQTMRITQEMQVMQTTQTMQTTQATQTTAEDISNFKGLENRKIFQPFNLTVIFTARNIGNINSGGRDEENRIDSTMPFWSGSCVKKRDYRFGL